MKHGIYRLPSGVLVVDVQSDLLNPTNTRVVVPLIASMDLKGAQPGRLTPILEVEGRTVMLLPLQMAAIPLRELGHQPLRMLTEDEAYAVRGALGVLFEGV
ncbi:CcdB family protein [Phenylobacterium sp.]|jgi:toxin CcdB|uniref:CcdB family protein n=1 Tax=Phenylobacterium sp. TaxID=1871053 RepID=UPI000C914EAF|nr:CcdB family protein [Phenylobacterium sp.]MAK81929.1 plasmid maintenance protein CcdB [Phenylobacterium sp.]|tara:strand:+ start:30724 stop:31026 length:303 start_codon:yes stop_codon:yes gene_type:complete